MRKINDLGKFPRQFVVSSKKTADLNELNYFEFGCYHVYHCITLSVHTFKNLQSLNFGLIFGYSYNPSNTELTEIDIIKELTSLNSIEEISRYVSGLAGRFVVFLGINGKCYVFNDPTGLRTVYYVNNTSEVIVGTQPLILGCFCDLKAGFKNELFFHSEYYLTADEYWLPCGYSIYENVEQLVPNHFLDLPSRKQFRFWPFEVLKKFDVEDNVTQLKSELIDSIEYAGRNFELALPLTSGLDSRLLLALSRKISSRLIIFTRIPSGDMGLSHRDVLIPGKLLKKLGLNHHIWNTKAEISIQTEERYKLNNSTSRFRDGRSLFSADASFLKGKCVLYGNLSEIIKIRNSYKEYLTLQDFDVLPKKWLEISSIRLHLENWLNEAKILENEYHINVYELFYWEHRIGNWAARAYNENDLLFDVFTPFNSRSILSKVLSIDIKDRGLPEAKLHRRLIQDLWREIDKFPYNSRSLSELIKSGLRKGMRIVGLASIIFRINKFLIK